MCKAISMARGASIATGIPALVIAVSCVGSTGHDGPAPHERLGAVLWAQTALEHEMACRQAFELARERLAEALADPSWTALPDQRQGFAQLPPAVIIDVDETALDNTPYQARLVLRGKAEHDPDLWRTWVTQARADALPGAREFYEFATERDVAVYFVSNRHAELEEETVANLRAVIDPVITAESVLLRGERQGWGLDKSSRRAHVAETHRVLLLLGDDFNDFQHLGRRSPEERLAAGREYRLYWGRRWILLPNPVYGSWERAAVGHGQHLTNDQKLRRKLDRLDPKE